MLFDDCVKVILSSIALVSTATQVLPKGIVQHILFIACNVRDYAVIQTILTSWPHPEISFDFMSNTLCRKYVELQQSCMDAQNYFNIKCSEFYDHCVPSIALGIFNNILLQQKCNSKPVFTEVDMSKIYLKEQLYLTIICKLAQGCYPVNHPSDYVSLNDKKAIVLAKPELHCAMDKISLILNVGITTRAGFNCIQKLISNHFIFNTTISGISLSQSLSMGQLSQVLSFFNGQQYSNISYDASLVSDTQVMPSLVIGGCLWLYSHQHQPQYQNYPSMLDKVLSNCTCRPFTMLVGNYDKKLFCTIPSSSIRAFAVLPDTEYSFNILHHSSESLKSVLLANKNTLEYLQLHRFPTALFGAMELHSLSNLRVLSVSSRTAKGHSPSTPIIQVCQTLQTLNLLEYFEWADVINLFANDLIAIYTTLKDYLPRLNHWHMSSFKVVLFTTLSDEDRKILDDLYKNLMEGKTGDVTCSTYKFSLDNLHFKNWLVLARPDVCINLQNKSKMVATSCLTF